MKLVVSLLLVGLPLAVRPLQAQTVRRQQPAASLPRLVAQPRTLAFGAVSEGAQGQLSFTLRNQGTQPASIDSLRFELGPSGTSESFSVDLLGTTYVGGSGLVSYTLSETLAGGASTPVDVRFTPTAEQLDDVSLRVGGDFPDVVVALSGLGGHAGDPYLHVVIDGPDVAIDYDADGSEPLLLDGSASHTHEPGFAIVGWTWKEGGTELGTDPLLSITSGLGPHTIELTIEDDNVPPRTLADTKTVEVVPASAIPGVLARYYDASGSSAAALVDAVPAKADFGLVRADLDLPLASAIGGSPFTADVMVQLVADVTIAVADTYDFVAAGGAARRLELNGTPVSGPQALSVGTYRLEARFAFDSLADLPAGVSVAQGAGAPAALDPSVLHHDQSGLVPILNTLPASGLDTGGNPITITGLGFFPAASLVLHWGGVDLTEEDFTSLTPGSIDLVTPPGPPGPISVTVQTPQGTSNVRAFSYQINGPVPITFVNTRTATVPQPTSAAWGPDGKLYVTALDGRLSVVGFSESYMLTSLTTHQGVSGLTNHDTLGIAFDPYDPPSPVRVYVAHGQHFVNGGTTPSGFSPYTGQISVLEGPTFDTPQPLVTGLPTSNHDHAINGIEFDNNGDLLICIGSNTNAGVAAPASGDLPESPLSAAIVKARTSDPAFDGAVTYVENVGGAPNDDQRFGESVELASGDLSVVAAGLRNPFDLVLTTEGTVYATDNGPNVGFGPASTGPASQDPDPYDTDELNLIEPGNYYGSPNRCRGRDDPRQEVYRPSSSGPSLPETFTQSLVSLLSSSDGLDEYRSNTFQGQMRGELLAQKWGSNVRRIRLADGGRAVDSVSVLDPWAGGLGLVTGPGGAILSLDHGNSKLRVLEPSDLSAFGLVAHDITPWRAPATGGARFVIGGVGFGSLSDTSVTIGGLPATLSSVGAKRIVGTVPPRATPTPDLLDVVVTVAGQSSTLTNGFRYLLGPGLEIGRWESRPALPVALGEVAAGVVDGVLYVVGEGDPATRAFDLINGFWLSARATRPFPGHHHGAEVLAGKLYLIGGLEDGSEGKLQIYDPLGDSWSLGADLPWPGSSVSTALIGGRIFAAGGIESGFTTNKTAVYDPQLDSWTMLAPMPDGRNHAAAATDGARLWIFGGRKGGNFPQNGFADVFVYDPAANAWDWTGAPGTSLVPMPYGRGGMGKAVWLGGEFYVFGGETLNGPGAVPGTNVYDRVDVYDPGSDTWRLDRSMPVPRHGVFPTSFQGLVLLPGGGLTAGNAQSTTFDVFVRP